MREPAAWVHAFLLLCLRAWPEPDRSRHGSDLVGTTLAVLSEAPGGARGMLAVAGEAIAIVRAGLARRMLNGRHGMEGWTMGWWSDVRFALRKLGRSRAFAGAAIVTLALGIGANAAVYSLVDGVVLRDPPYGEPDDLVFVWNTLPGSNDRLPVAGPDAAVLRERAAGLAGVAFSVRGADGTLQVGSGEGALHVRLASVTDDFFDVLDVEPAIGRTFVEGDGPAGVEPAGPQQSISVVISDPLWRVVFAADPSVVGRDVRLNGVPVSVVGVMPPEFRLLLPPGVGVETDIDIWVPLRTSLSDFHRVGGRLLDRDSDNTGSIVARLAPGVSVESAQRQVARVAAELRAEVPEYAEAGLDLDVRPLQEDATAHARPLLGALMAAACVLLVVACLNVGTLIVSRSVDRAREFSVRSALGGGRARLLRQLFVEGVVLAAAGCVASVPLAHAVVAWASPVLPVGLSVPGGLSLNWAGLSALALCASVITVGFGMLAGLPGFASLAQGVFNSRRNTSSRGAVRVRAGLVVLQVGLAVVLALGAGLLSRTVDSLQGVRPGFEAEGAVAFSVSMRVAGRYRGPGLRAERMKELEDALAALPGVTAVGRTGMVPLSDDRWTRPFGLPGQAETEWGDNRADFRSVSSGYFDAIGTRLREGRRFTSTEDLEETERIVVIDERLAARVAPNGSAVGTTIGIPLDGAAVEARVVGVVEHVRHDRLEADGLGAIYVPYRQEASRDVSFVVRTEGDAADRINDISAAVRAIDPMLPVYDAAPLRQNVARYVAPRRFGFGLLLVFAGLALLCAAVGVYGVVALDVQSRTGEIGIRMAVGARRETVLRAFLVRGLRLAAWGALVGLLISVLVAPRLDALLFGVGVADPLTWITVLCAVGVLTGAASMLPAVAASRVDPARALTTG